METWIALFRGLNVGGNNILPMSTLKSDLEGLKLKRVRSYIQSGNVVFEAAIGTVSTLEKKIARRIETKHGFRPRVFVYNRTDWALAMEANPFPGAVLKPQTLHLFFLADSATDADLSAIERVKAASERYRLTDGVFYLHAPEGIGRSKLAGKVEQYLGVATTARNFRTVTKLMSMADEC